MLERRTGVQLPEPQQPLLQTQVSLRMRELGIEHRNQYLDYLSHGIGGLAEWQILIDRLVVKETTFFRSRPSVELVRRYIQERLSEHSDAIELWSVGCSTGEEPYTLAAVAGDCYQQAGLKSYYGVTGADISLPALSVARSGKYARRSLVNLTHKELEKYFHSCGNHQYRVKDVIRQRVCFTQLNVLDLQRESIQPMDIIYCQNVLIYFRPWRRREILANLVNNLKTRGLLIVGSGEAADWKHPSMQRLAIDEVQAYVKRPC